MAFVGVYEDTTFPSLKGLPVYYYRHTSTVIGKTSVMREFVDDIQNGPAKGVFTSKEAAEAFYEAAKAAFASNPEWQKDHAELEEESRRDWEMMDDMLDEEFDDMEPAS